MIMTLQTTAATRGGVCFNLAKNTTIVFERQEEEKLLCTPRRRSNTTEPVVDLPPVLATCLLKSKIEPPRRQDGISKLRPRNTGDSTASMKQRSRRQRPRLESEEQEVATDSSKVEISWYRVPSCRWEDELSSTAKQQLLHSPVSTLLDDSFSSLLDNSSTNSTRLLSPRKPQRMVSEESLDCSFSSHSITLDAFSNHSQGTFGSGVTVPDDDEDDEDEYE